MEQTPIITKAECTKALIHTPSAEMIALIDKVNENYEYWDTVKYKKVPDPYTVKDLWVYLYVDRLKHNIDVWKRYGVHFSLTNQIQRQCHEFDMNFGGSWGTNSIIPDDKERYLISSLMEEAISSSQMEGATTTRKVAKEMLRKKITPKDKSQQMIFNNYQTIQFIVAHKKEPLTKELLLETHRLMTEKTLEKEDDAGRLRTDNEVVVENAITHDIVHIPPSFEEIPIFVDKLCEFFNETDSDTFIHPIIKGIIIHFMLAYMHPFADGNGRTARALFYWYMLKQGYWLTEYLSISRIIAKSKKSYEKSFLYAEADKNNIGYFIAYNLRVLELAFKELQLYINRKVNDKKVAATFLRLSNINERQAEVIKLYYDDPKKVLTIKDLQVRFAISPTTAKTDIVGLLKMNLLEEISYNKVKKGYIRGSNFVEIIKQAGL